MPAPTTRRCTRQSIRHRSHRRARGCGGMPLQTQSCHADHDPTSHPVRIRRRGLARRARVPIEATVPALLPVDATHRSGRARLRGQGIASLGVRGRAAAWGRVLAGVGAVRRFRHTTLTNWRYNRAALAGCSTLSDGITREGTFYRSRSRTPVATPLQSSWYLPLFGCHRC